MQISVYPNEKFARCLVLVGGSGDTTQGFLPLVELLIQKIPTTNICTFTFSSKSKAESILDIQARELVEVMDKLKIEMGYKSIDILATSMGAYSTVKLLSSHNYSDLIRKVIFFDPADYYLSAKFANSRDTTWSGSELFGPTKPVVSDELKKIDTNVKISVVHLTLRNYGPTGYLMKDYGERGKDCSNGHPRLNTEMVKKFYDKIPQNNKEKYVELPNIPHAILRDGNIINNLTNTVNAIIKLM